MTCPSCDSTETLLVRIGARCEACGHEWRRLRTTRRDPELLRAVAEELQAEGLPADAISVLEKVPQIEDDTEALARGDPVVVLTIRDPPFEIGERIEILDANWHRVCWAEVTEAFVGIYVLRGVTDRRMDD